MTADDEQKTTAAGKPDQCVLVVDDSHVVRYTVANIIRAMGHKVVEAVDGTEVVAAAEEHRPDLIVLDVRMPEKGGIEALRELRTHADFKEVPVVMLTATADQKIVRQAAALNISGYLVKTDLKAADIRARINKVLGRPATPPPSRKARRALHVLVADDNPHDQQLIAGLLRNWGYAVEIAQSGSEALAILQQQGAVDLVLMDDDMPEMDGFAAAAAIRQQESASGEYLPIAILTSRPIEEVSEGGQEAGIDAYVAKPVNPDKLFTTLEEMASLVPSPSAPEPADQSLFDWEDLMERVDDDLDLLQRMLELFVRDYPELLEAARQAIAGGDVQQLKTAAHTLKGMLGNLSADSAVQVTQKLETMDPQEDREQVEEVFLNLEKQVERLSRALATALNQERG